MSNEAASRFAEPTYKQNPYAFYAEWRVEGPVPPPRRYCRTASTCFWSRGIEMSKRG